MAGWLAFAPPALAQSADFTGTSQVVDYAGMLSSSTARQLEKQARNIEYISKRQIVILTVKSLEGRTAENYADWIANEWNLGAETKGAALLLVSQGDKVAHIKTVGEGMEMLEKPGVKDGITNVIAAALKKGNGQSAVMAGAGKMISTLTGQAMPKISGLPKKTGDWVQIGLLVFVIFLRMRYYRRRSLGGMVVDGLLGGARRRW
jgi:uncharacterized protein